MHQYKNDTQRDQNPQHATRSGEPAALYEGSMSVEAQPITDPHACHAMRNPIQNQTPNTRLSIMDIHMKYLYIWHFYTHNSNFAYEARNATFPESSRREI